VATVWRRSIGVASLAACLIVAAAAAQTSAEYRDYDEPPKLLKQTKPKYPAEPFYKGIEGTVDIEFVVDEKGRVTNPKVIKSIAGLDRAALDCVRKWKFRPARKEGRPVKATAQAPITFRITGKKQ
jgi:TonB family protein